MITRLMCPHARPGKGHGCGVADSRDDGRILIERHNDLLEWNFQGLKSQPAEWPCHRCGKRVVLDYATAKRIGNSKRLVLRRASHAPGWRIIRVRDRR